VISLREGGSNQRSQDRLSLPGGATPRRAFAARLQLNRPPGANHVLRRKCLAQGEWRRALQKAQQFTRRQRPCEVKPLPLRAPLFSQVRALRLALHTRGENAQLQASGRLNQGPQHVPIRRIRGRFANKRLIDIDAIEGQLL
jgi:hypothetical protein